jgi:hypothetical protein
VLDLGCANFRGQMRPHLEGALAALAQIEERRKLTDKELSYRRAFKMLSESRQ